MSFNNKSSLAGSDFIQQHPPERGTRNDHHVVLFSGCSCCCCCCLHTVGGMIGVAVVGNHRAEPDASADSQRPLNRLPSSQGMFWSSFLAVSLSALVIGTLINVSQTHDALWILMLCALFGPLFLLGTSVISALQIAVRIPSPLQRGYWRHLGMITLGMLAGSIFGFLIMLPMF